MRDRDSSGRPQQARPRDALGRPLPYGSAGVEPITDELRSPADTLELARRLIDEARPFAAHEVFEARWKGGPAEERDLWQGLAQLCVALTHALRGNEVGAERLLSRATERLQGYSGPRYDLDLPEVVACAQRRARSPR